MAKMTASFLFDGISGRVGRAVFVRTKYGAVVRDKPFRRAPSTPAMVEAQARMRTASRAYGTLTREEGIAWGRYAASIAAPDPETGVVVAPSGQQAYNALATRLLQMSPQGALPRLPPEAPFPGDGVRVTIEAETLTPPAALGPGERVVRLRADVPNRPGVVTELRAQPLASIHRRTYASRYRSVAFVPFTEAAPTHDLPLNGLTAFAYRFVEVATGRVTPLIEIGVVA